MSLLMKRTQPATSTILSSVSMSRPAMFTDSTAFDPLYDDIMPELPRTQNRWRPTAPTRPLGYANAFLKAAEFLLPAYTRPKTKETATIPWWTYVYDEYFDDVICPEYKVLHYSTTNRDGYREYKSRSYLCARHVPTKGDVYTKVPSAKKPLLAPYLAGVMWKWRRMSGTRRCTGSIYTSATRED